jgi:hypothetical protein
MFKMSSNPSRATGLDAQELEVLAGWAPELADTFTTLGFDLAVVVDVEGIVVHRAQADNQALETCGWQGLPWVDTATPDSRHKLQSLVNKVLSTGRAHRHEINHRGPPAAPVAWRAVRLGPTGPVLAVGQDLRSQVELQQRFLAAQEALERSYWNAQRHMLESGDERPSMTADERRMLGLDEAPEPEAAADALQRALDKLHERIGKDSLSGLLRDARRLAEQQFLTLAVQRAGSLDELARALGVSRRSLLRRGGQALRQRKPH